VSSALIGARMPVQSGMQWLSIIPITASRSSYDGLLVFLFMIASATLAAAAIHRFASNRLRRAPAWDCGYPDPSLATQYTAMSFAQPIRRVFGSVVFQAREAAGMPPPGDTRPAWLKVELHDPVWEYLYAPLAAAIGRAADRLNRLQFLTIRQFLTLVFGALVILLMVLAVWS
jgi:hydrogenase-4 component B